MDRPPAREGSKGTTRPPWAGEFAPELIARIVLPPVWTFRIAEQTGFPGSGTAGGIGLVLDALAHAGLIEARPTLRPSDWTLTLQPLATQRQILGPEGRTLAQARVEARQIGLLAEQELHVTPAADAGEPITRPIALRLPDVQLRSRGFRFRDNSGLRVAQRLDAVFARSNGHGQQSFKIGGTVIATHRSGWSGQSAVVMLDITSHLRGEFPAGEMFAEFRARPRIRGTVLDRLRQEGYPLTRLAVTLAHEIRRAVPESELPGPLAMWVKLAALAGSEAELIRALDAELKPLFVNGNTSEAEAWLATAQLLALATGGALETAVLLGQRRLEWTYRRLVDQRMLESYVPRAELLEAFEDVLRDERGPWAVHYLGVGGVGKTMFVRYLTARLAKQLPVSRVDFDFLSPDYPVRRPAQLLLELGDGLRGFGGMRTDEIFLKFQDQVTALHAALEAAPPIGDELAALEDPRFEVALALFCEFLHELVVNPALPTRLPRCVFILDTCEELARLRPDGEFSPAVAATFAILERVHERVPALRAVFAGRRLLSQRGAGWQVRGVATPAKAGRSPAPDYLRLKLVRGFTRDEARELLLRLKAPKPETGRTPMSEALVDVILQASPESRLTIKIDPDPDAGAGQGGRYNPFQLALYADWFLEEPELAPATIASGETDPYVEKRILGRLRHPEVLAVLPHLILLRRVDEAMLRRILARLDEAAFANVFRELCQLEWIEYQSAASGDAQGVFLEVERHLRPRIERCLRAERERDLANARDELAPLLRAAVIDPDKGEALPTGRLVIEHLEAALRLLPAAEAAEVWSLVEVRVTQEAAWSWVRQVCERLLAEDEGEFEPTSPPVPALVAPPAVRSHLRATLLAALLRTDPGRVTASAWVEVGLHLHACPDARVRDWLAWREKIGGVISRARALYVSEGGTLLELIEGLQALPAAAADDPASRFRAEQSAAAGLAAADAVLEMAESGFERLFQAATPVQLPAFPMLPGALQRQHWLVRRRWARLHGVELREPEGEPPPIDAEHGRTDEWLDFLTTPETPERLRFETLHELTLAGEHGRAGQFVAPELAWIARPDLVINNADEHALATFAFRWQLAQRAMPYAEALSILRAPGANAPWVPARVSHRRMPPLFVVVAEALLAQGNTPSAHEILYEGTSRQSDPAAVRYAEAMRLKIARRMRLEHQAAELVARAAASEDPVEWGLGCAVRRLTQAGPAPGMPRPTERDFEARACAAWRVQDLLTPAGRAFALAEGQLAFAAPVAKPAGPDEPRRDQVDPWFRLFQCEHALLEHHLRADASEQARAFVQLVEAAQLDCERDWRLRVWLAVWREQTPTREWLRGEATLREAGDWAIDEGELLALRWPAAGARLLDFASRCFEEAGPGDGASEFIASLRAVIARIHAGERDALNELLGGRVRSSYERLRAIDSSVPEFGQLAAGTAELGRTQPDWLPWLRRLQHGTRFGASAAASSPGKLEAWAKTNESDRDPLELRFWIPAEAAPLAKETAAAPEPAPEPKSSGPLRWVHTLGLVTLGFGILALFFSAPIFALYVVFQAVMPGDDRELGLTDWVLVVLGWMILVVGVVRLFHAIRARLARRSELLLTLTGDEPAVRATLQHAKIFVRRADFLLPNTWLRRRIIVQKESEWREATSPETPATFVGEIGGELEQWSHWLGKDSLGIALVTDRRLAQLPWERRLMPEFCGDTARGEAVAWRHFQLYRWLPAGAGESRPLARADTVLLMTSPRWQAALETAWAETRLQSLPVLDHWFKIEALEPWPDRVRVLHFVGRPVDGPSGIGLKIDANREFLQQTANTGSAPPWRDDVVVSAGRRGLERIPLLIVQGEPSAVRELNETDRRETQRLRQFCHDTFAGGANAILMIPAVQSELFRTVVARLARQAGAAAQLERDELLELALAVRDVVASWRPAAAADSAPSEPDGLIAATQRELALAVTLFVRHPFKHLKPSTQDTPHA